MDLKNLKYDEPLVACTMFRVGGKAKFFFEANGRESFQQAVLAAKSKNIPHFILGGGTNILVSDEGFDGLVIKSNCCGIKILDDGLFFAEAGVSMGALVNKAKISGLSGLEWAAGLPGTLGGAVFGNAGALGGEIADSIQSIKVFDIENNILKEYSKDECGFAYRHSKFKTSPQLIILGALLKLDRGDVSNIAAKMAKNMKSRVDHQPLEFKSCGCVFKNVDLAISPKAKQLVADLEEFRRFENAKFLPAGFLIDKAGLKGLEAGGAAVSEKHGNFILNKSGASAKDIFLLIQLIKEKILQLYDIEISEEIRFLGNFS